MMNGTTLKRCISKEHTDSKASIVLGKIRNSVVTAE